MEKEDIKKLKKGQFTCTRTVYYSAKRLIEIEEIPVTEIKNGVLNYSISDFSELKKYLDVDLNAGFALRFENERGEFKTLKIGSNMMYQDSHKKDTPDESKLEKNIVLDYSTNERISDNSYISDSTNLDILDFNYNTITFNILYIILAMVITIISELFIAKIMNINSTRVIIIVNIITQLLLHAFTYIVIPIIYSKILYYITEIIIAIEILIVLIEFIVYSIKIKEQSAKKLFFYSFIANLTSFGFSVLVQLIFNL